MLTKPTVNSSKRVPIIFIVDVSGSTRFTCGIGSKTPNVLINAQIRNTVANMCKNSQLKVRGEVVIIKYSNEMEIMVDKNAGTGKPPKYVFEPFNGGDEENRYGYKADYFLPISQVNNHVPQIAPTGGGTYTARALEAACHLRLQRSKDILSQSVCDISPAVAIIMTDGGAAWQESPEYIDKVIRMTHELSCAKESERKIIPIVIGLGDNLDDTTKKTLARISEPITGANSFFWVKGESDGEIEEGIEKLYSFIGQSIVASSNYVERSVDALLEGLRQQVREVCPELLCTVH